MIQREKVTRTPLLWPAVAMTLGIVFGRYSGADWRVVSIAASLVFVGRIFMKRDWLALGFWFFLGTSLLAFRMDAGAASDLRKIFGAEAELVTIRGTISVEPERRVLEQDHRAKHRTTARVAVSEIQRHGAWQAVSGNLAVSTPGFLGEEFVAGSQVEIFGVIAPPLGPQAPGLFDFEQYLRWQRTFFVLRAEQTNDWKLVRPAGGWSFAALYRTFNTWARATLQRGLPEDQNTRLLWAMTLGWKPGLTNEISEPFMRTGTLDQLTFQEIA